MSYTLHRCDECGEPVDDDDEEFRAGHDDPDLCGICNASYSHPLARQ